MPRHNGSPIWKVTYQVIAPVTLEATIDSRARKDFSQPTPFYSDVKILPGRGSLSSKSGFNIEVTAFATNSNEAQEVGHVFIGRMLDYLCFRINCPIYVFSAEYSIRLANEIGAPLRILDDSDFSEAFMESRKLILGNSTFLRALGWFRKGKNSHDPLDKYLAYWNAIEIVASKYNPNKERCQKKGSICSIWECFKTVWGDCDQWPVIGGQVNWIDTSNRNRVDIAHGVMPIEIEQVKRIVNSLGNLEEVCHNFLVSWFPLLSSEVPHDLIE